MITLSRKVSNIEFDQQVDYMCKWLEAWDEIERSNIVEVLLSRCELEQISFLWTVVEPLLHRDFMYSSLNAFPRSSFSPVSTPVCREVHKKLGKPRYRAWKLHRLESAVLHDEGEVHEWSSHTVLPIVKSPSPTRLIENTPSQKRIYKSKSCPSMSTQVGRPYSKNRKQFPFSRSRQAPPLAWLPENAQCVVQWFEEKWDGSQRNHFLQLFLRILEPAELYLLSGLLAVRQFRDFISLLPDELSLKVLSYLRPNELLVAAQVCKFWQGMASRDELWQAKCRLQYVGVPLSVPDIWKDIFRRNINLKRNWAEGRCKVMEISGHTKSVFSVCECMNKIASGSLDRTVKVWDATTGNLLQSLHGHTRGIWCLRFLSSSILISGSYDKSIRVWNLRTGICARILLSHEAPIWAIERKKDILISGSGDKTAKLWNIRQCKLLCTLFGHTGSVFCVDLDDAAKRAFTGSADRTVRIWDVASGACVGIVYAGLSNASAITSVSYDQDYIAVAAGNLVSLWNLANGTCSHEFKGHKARIESVRLRFMMVNGRKESGVIVSAGKDSMIKYWDIERGTCIQTLRSHKDAVNCIHFDDTRIISASYDNRIRIWDFNT
ncbi:F-box/WD repeat-containing protein 7 isoform X2 [Nematostella vectensis]|uniref:F-box/WD repeat-containing protein 7 isoform X2 n=1 Tax=Nematostella vectensis TaxID=45351 RepID=UPI0020778519|nr:F-box/WD repeat-containing protein 7 isoform X2 [Nematostella vectensis]